MMAVASLAAWPSAPTARTVTSSGIRRIVPSSGISRMAEVRAKKNALVRELFAVRILAAREHAHPHQQLDRMSCGIGRTADIQAQNAHEGTELCRVEPAAAVRVYKLERGGHRIALLRRQTSVPLIERVVIVRSIMPHPERFPPPERCS